MTGNTFTPDSVNALRLLLCGGLDCRRSTPPIIEHEHLGHAELVRLCLVRGHGSGGRRGHSAATGVADQSQRSPRPSRRDPNFEATPTVNGTCNWWGAATGPAAGQMVGAVDALRLARHAGADRAVRVGKPVPAR